MKRYIYVLCVVLSSMLLYTSCLGSNDSTEITVYDDMAIAEGQIRLRLDGSSGGHKGIQNIIDKLGTEKIKRIRIGIGEPQFDSIDFVLGKPSAESMPLIEEATDNAAKALLDIERRGFQFAMTRYNSIKKKEEK